MNSAPKIVLAFLAVAVAMVFLGSSRLAPRVSAATVPVTNTADSGPGSLRQALLTYVAGDTIAISAVGQLDLLSALPVVSRSVTIQGPPGGGFTINAGGFCPLCSGLVQSGAPAPSVLIMDIRITGAAASGIQLQNGFLNLIRVTLESNQGTNGGGLQISSAIGAAASIAESRFLTNVATSSGGGIFAGSSVSITNTIIRGNQAASGAGGLFLSNSVHSIGDSEVSGNITTASGPGGIDVCAGCTIQIIQSTLSGNGGANGGAVVTQGGVRIVQSTIANNTSAGANAGGLTLLASTQPSIDIRNSIVANNTGGGGNCRTTGVAFISSGNNHSTDASACNFVQAGDVANQPLTLGPLAANGGFTRTMALLPGTSPVDTGSPAACIALPTAEDQRRAGFPRVLDGNNDGIAICDKGAYELAPPLVPTVLKDFSPQASPFVPTTQFPLGSIAYLRLRITNPNLNLPLTNVSISDHNMSGLVVAQSVANPDLNIGCGAPTVSGNGTSSFTISGATIAANSTCTYAIPVRATAAGSFVNVTTTVTSAEAGPGGPATAPYTIVSPSSVTKSFTPDTVVQGGVSTLRITLPNPNTSTALTGVGISDTLPPGMLVASPPNVTNTCGGSVAAVPGTNSVVLTGGTIAAGSSCTFTVQIQGNTVGNLLNTTGNATSVEGGQNGNASATLIVTAPNTPTPTPTPTQVPLQVRPVIPQVFQHLPQGIFYGNRSTPTPQPFAVSPLTLPAPALPATMPALRPPSTGDAGLQPSMLTLKGWSWS